MKPLLYVASENRDTWARVAQISSVALSAEAPLSLAQAIAHFAENGGAPFAYVMGPSVLPPTSGRGAPAALPVPDAAVSRKGRFGWVNPLDYCSVGGTAGLRVYPKWFPYAARNRPDNPEATIAKSDESAPELALYSFVVGGASPELNAIDRTVLFDAHVGDLEFPEDRRIRGFRLAPGCFAAMSSALAITQEAAKTWALAYTKFPHPAFAGYVTQAWAHSQGLACGVGGPVMAGAPRSREKLFDIGDELETAGLFFVERIATALESWRYEVGESAESVAARLAEAIQ